MSYMRGKHGGREGGREEGREGERVYTSIGHGKWGSWGCCKHCLGFIMYTCACIHICIPLIRILKSTPTLAHDAANMGLIDISVYVYSFKTTFAWDKLVKTVRRKYINTYLVAPPVVCCTLYFPALQHQLL